MSSTQHTEGRLSHKGHGVIIGGAPVDFANGSAQQQVAMCTVLEDGDKDANARRLVACWNALEHLTTEGIERLADQGGAMPDQRVQQLVDALAKTETYLQERVGSNPGSRGATVILPMIRAAIEGAGVAPTQTSWGDC